MNQKALLLAASMLFFCLLLHCCFCVFLTVASDLAQGDGARIDR